MRLVILNKLEESTQEIIEKNEKKMEKLKVILDEYGSIEAYR